MIAALLLLATVAAPVPFDHTLRVSWDAEDRRIRAQGVADSSASDLGDRGVRLRAEAKTDHGRLAVLDLDLVPTELGHVRVGKRLLARYDELTPQGVAFHAARAEGSVAVARLVRGDEDAHVELTFDLTFTDAGGRQRTLVGSASTPTPAERVVHAAPPPDPEVEVATGCAWAPPDDDDRDHWSSSDTSGGCEGDPGPGAGVSDDSGSSCEGDSGPSGGGGGGDGGCEGDPALRSARAHGPLMLIGLVLGLRRRRGPR